MFKQSRSLGSESGVSSVMTIRVMLLSFVQCISVGPWSVVALIPGVLPEIKAVDTVTVCGRNLHCVGSYLVSQ